MTKKSKAKARREAVFHPEFIEDLWYWIAEDRRTTLRAVDIIEAVLRNPFHGVGKPEALKHQLQGSWSRQLTREHRIVYRVAARRVDFLQARCHY